MKKLLQSAVAIAALAAAAQASAVTLTFDELVVGTTLADQYVAFGATFSPNAFSGPGTSSSGKDWATNTDMTIVSATGDLVGAFGVPTPSGPDLVGGNLLHSFGSSKSTGGWLAEDGDSSFKITFSGAGALNFSAAFAGVDSPEDVHVYAYNGITQIGDVTSEVVSGQFILSFSAPKITSVVITPGSFNDWVGVDNITYTLAPVPEPETYAMLGLGLGVVALARRRAKAAA